MKDGTLKILKATLDNCEDDLYRVKTAFRGYSDEQLDRKYGQSDDTCREVRDKYQSRVNHVKYCIKWVKMVSV